jgi:hypothetical protein
MIHHSYGCQLRMGFPSEASGSMTDVPPGCLACMHRDLTPGSTHEMFGLWATRYSGLNTRLRFTP